MTSIAASNPEAIARIVATGEETATAFLALELDRFGIPAQVLDPSQIQLIAETTSNDTEPVSAELSAIDGVFDQGKVAVIPGFVARDRSGRVALFGRGGSDLSALFLAKQLERALPPHQGCRRHLQQRSRYLRRRRALR